MWCNQRSKVTVQSVSSVDHCRLFSHRTAVKRLVADLVTKTLRSNDGDLIADTLVGLEVEGEFGVVPFDNDLS